jgi:hypothetical protein
MRAGAVAGGLSPPHEIVHRDQQRTDAHAADDDVNRAERAAKGPARDRQTEEHDGGNERSPPFD